MSKNLSILVNSCDLYESVWDPFFKLFAIQWPDCPYDIYLNTETKSYECDFLNVKTICTGNDVPWTARIKRALKEIDSEYVLFFLEDFFLLKPVAQATFEKIFEAMCRNKSVGFLFFKPQGIEGESSFGVINEYFMKIYRYHPYRANACLGLWRKEFLLQMLFEDVNAWDFEHSASKLSHISKYKCCVIRNQYRSVLSYSISPNLGLGITKKKWLRGTKKLLETYGITADFDQLGFLDSSGGNRGAESVFDPKASVKKKSKNRLLKKLTKFGKCVACECQILKTRIVLGSKFKKYCHQVEQGSYR